MQSLNVRKQLSLKARTTRRGSTVKIITLFLTLHVALATVPCYAAEELNVVGTGDGMEILKALASGFALENPEIKINIPPSVHSLGGIRAVRAGDAVLGRIARSLQGDELGFGLQVIPIFSEPTVFYTHPSANVRSLTVRQLADIFSGTVKNWIEVGGNNLRIRVVRREEADSSLLVLRTTLPGWKDLEITKHSKVAITTQEAFDTVAKFEGAVGFGPYTRELDRRLTVLGLEGLHPGDPLYPSKVTVALIYKDTTVTEAANKFIDFVFTEKAQEIARNLGASHLSAIVETANGK